MEIRTSITKILTLQDFKNTLDMKSPCIISSFAIQESTIDSNEFQIIKEGIKQMCFSSTNYTVHHTKQMLTSLYKVLLFKTQCCFK